MDDAGRVRHESRRQALRRILKEFLDVCGWTSTKNLPKGLRRGRVETRNRQTNIWYGGDDWDLVNLRIIHDRDRKSYIRRSILPEPLQRKSVVRVWCKRPSDNTSDATQPEKIKFVVVDDQDYPWERFGVLLRADAEYLSAST